MYLKIWDVGGQHSLRNIWTSYYSVCHAIVFVVDSCDVGDGTTAESDAGASSSSTTSTAAGATPTTTTAGRLHECQLALETILEHPSTKSIPLLVLANKQDREDCVETVRIKEGLVRKVFESERGGEALRDTRVLPCSALTGMGVREAVEWVRTRVRWNREGRAPVMR